MRDRVPAERVRQGRHLCRRILGVYVAVGIGRGKNGISAVLDSLARHAAIAVIRYGFRNAAVGRVSRAVVIGIRIGIGIRPQRAVVIDAGGNGRNVLVRVIGPRDIRDEVRPVRHDDARQAVHGVIAVVLGSHQRFARPPDVKMPARRALLYDFVSLVRYENAAFVYLDFFRKHRCEFPI